MTDSSRNNLSNRNIKAVKEIYTAFAKRDMNAILAVLHPEVEWG